MATLYEVTDQVKQLIQMSEDPDVDREVLRDTIDSVEGEYEDKMESYVIAIKKVESDMDMFKREIERLQRILSTGNNAIKQMKIRMLDSMDELDIQKVKTEHFTLSRVKNGGLQPMWITPNIDDIPEEFIIRKPMADTDKIRDALKKGKSLGFAGLEERGVHLAIR